MFGLVILEREFVHVVAMRPGGMFSLFMAHF
jgi:hypothetical protein